MKWKKCKDMPRGMTCAQTVLISGKVYVSELGGVTILDSDSDDDSDDDSNDDATSSNSTAQLMTVGPLYLLPLCARLLWES